MPTGRAQLVGGDGEELGPLVGGRGQELVRDAEVAVDLFQRFGRRDLSVEHLAAFGDVAGDLGEADVPARVVVDGGDDDVGPEPAAVLADAPAFFFVVAFAQGDFEFVLGVAAGLVVGG